MKSILMLSALSLVSASLANAQTVINITGATAFRSAASTALKAAFTANLTYAFNGSSFTGAQYQILKGDFSGITGTTIIRTNWSGSVEGIRDLAQNNTIDFLPTSTTTSGGNGTSGALTTGLQSATAHLAFSDIYAASTPYDNGNVEGVPVGIIAFRFVASRNANGILTNVTPQQFRNLATSGFAKASLFTGNATHTTPVYLTGRNDGSGTRVTVLAETGKGYSQLVQQYKGTLANSNSTISDLELWPTLDGTSVSNIYNTDTAGNGGYTSGGTIATLLGGNSTSVNLRAAGNNGTQGAILSGGANKTVYVLGYLGTNDSNTAVTNGGVALSYNGVSLSVNSLGITNPEVIQKGAYTLWANEQLYWRSGTDTGAVLTVKNKLISDIPTNLGNAGLALGGNMTVSRAEDGGLVGE